MPEDYRPKWSTPEFLLVIVMLIVMLALVSIVLMAPVPGLSEVTEGIEFREILDYRKSILAIIITAFGAWIGAGAAYYFGRENLREASNSMLAMREKSPMEILREKKIRELPLRPLEWKVGRDISVEEVLKILKTEQSSWFIPIVNKDGSLDTVLNEEAIWRFIATKSELPSKQGGDYKDIVQNSLEDVIEFLNDPQHPGLQKLQDIAIKVSLDKSVAEANEEMSKKAVFLSIVINDNGKPTHFLTTGDVRLVLLN